MCWTPLPIRLMEAQQRLARVKAERDAAAIALMSARVAHGLHPVSGERLRFRWRTGPDGKMVEAHEELAQ